MGLTCQHRRVVATPTKLYNKHWDNLIAHVRDNHPRDILQYQVTPESADWAIVGLKYPPRPVSNGLYYLS